MPGYSFALLIKSPSLATQPFSLNSATFYDRLRLRTTSSNFQHTQYSTVLTDRLSFPMVDTLCVLYKSTNIRKTVCNIMFSLCTKLSQCYVFTSNWGNDFLFTVCNENLLSHFRLVAADPHERLPPSPTEMQLGKWKCLQEVIHLLHWLDHARHTSHCPLLYKVYLLFIFVGNMGKSARNSRCGPHLVYECWRTCRQRFVLWRIHMHPCGSVRLQVHDVPCWCVSVKI